MAAPYMKALEILQAASIYRNLLAGKHLYYLDLNVFLCFIILVFIFHLLNNESNAEKGWCRFLFSPSTTQVSKVFGGEIDIDPVFLLLLHWFF